MPPSTTAEIGDADLDAGDGDPDRAEHAAERHHQGESDRQHPDCRRAQLRPPHAHRDHRDDVVEPEDRMLDPGDEAAAHIALADMGERNSGREQPAQRQPACRVAVKQHKP